MRRAARISLFAGAVLALAACAPEAPVTRDAPVEVAPQDYRGIDTRLLEGDLVQFVVQIAGEPTSEAVSRYAECAAAQYALIRGYGFARHVRTKVEKRGGQSVGDAVYTISAALPRGLRTIDAEVVVAVCAEDGIPMV